MPTTTPELREVLAQHGLPPRAISPTGDQLVKSSTNSTEHFYGSSQSLQNYDLPISENITKFRADFWDTVTETRKLLGRADGWNGYDALAPTFDTVNKAYAWIKQLSNEVLDIGGVWIKPNVTAGANGEVVFEWWNGPKTLTVYIEDDSTMYVQSWGIDIDQEMNHGEADHPSVCRALWMWLVYP